jgi:hypothetical protein
MSSAFGTTTPRPQSSPAHKGSPLNAHLVQGPLDSNPLVLGSSFHSGGAVGEGGRGLSTLWVVRAGMRFNLMTGGS